MHACTLSMVEVNLQYLKDWNTFCDKNFSHFTQRPKLHIIAPGRKRLHRLCINEKNVGKTNGLLISDESSVLGRSIKLSCVTIFQQNSQSLWIYAKYTFICQAIIENRLIGIVALINLLHWREAIERTSLILELRF